MIERISGVLVKCLPTHVIVDVQGVGYSLELPLSVLVEIPPEGSSLTLWVYTHVREDAIRLYGFLRYADRVAFEILLQLNGVGPKVALATMSALSVATLCRAVESNSIEALQRIPGVGPRKAEKILVELKSKIVKLKAAATGLPLPAPGATRVKSDEFFDQDIGVEAGVPLDDVRSALENLGFKEKQYESVLKSVSKDLPTGKFQDLLRAALVALAKPSPEAADLSVGVVDSLSVDGRDSKIF